jgi:hypothetical protein
MRPIRSRLSYANVISTLCLFLLLGGGTAVALNGSNTVFSDDIVNGQVRSQDLAQPQRAAGAVFARMQDLGDGTVFGAVSGLTPPSTTPVDVEGRVTSRSPNAPIVARDFVVSFRPDTPGRFCNPGPCSRRFTLRDDGADTSVACTIPGTQITCKTGNRSAVIAPGSSLSIKYTRQGSVTQGDALIGWRAATP